MLLVVPAAAGTGEVVADKVRVSLESLPLPKAELCLVLGRAQPQPLPERVGARACTQEARGCFLVIDLQETQLMGWGECLLYPLVKAS